MNYTWIEKPQEVKDREFRTGVYILLALALFFF